MLLVLFSPIGIDIFLPSIPSMQEVFDTTATQIQFSLSLYVLAMGFGQLFVGPLVDRFGRRPVALIGIGVYFLASLAIGFTWNLSQLLCLRMLQGVGASCTAIVAFTVVRDTYRPNEGAKVYSYLNGALNLVPALAPLLGGILSDWLGWRSNFHFLALFSVLVFLIILRWLPETRPETTSNHRLFSIKPYLDILENRQFLIYAICAMGAMSVVLSYAIYAPQVLMVKLGLSSSQFALLFGVNALVIMSSSFLAPYCIRRVGRRRSVEIGSMLMLTSGLLIPLLFKQYGHSVVGFMLPVAVASCGFSLILGAAASLSLEPFGDRAGRAAALQGCFQMLGAAAMSMLASLLPFALVLSLATLMVVFGMFGIFARRFYGPVHLELSS